MLPLIVLNEAIGRVAFLRGLCFGYAVNAVAFAAGYYVQDIIDWVAMARMERAVFRILGALESRPNGVGGFQLRRTTRLWSGEMQRTLMLLESQRMVISVLADVPPPRARIFHITNLGRQLLDAHRRVG